MKTTSRANSWIGDFTRTDSSWLAKFARFLAVGALNAGAGFLLFVLFFSVFALHYLLANALAFISWAWFGFELQRRWVFRARVSGAGFGRFVVNQIVFVFFGSILLWVFVEGFHTRPELAYIFTLGIVAIGIYVSSLFWVFRRGNQVRE